jgi:hypothetical protein
VVLNITTKPKLVTGMRIWHLTKSNKATMMLKRVMELFHSPEPLELIKRVINRCHGHFLKMATLDGLTMLWFKTLILKVGCASISEIESQMLKKAIKLQLLVLVKTQDQ